MSNSADLDSVLQQLEQSTISTSGVSFAGKSLKIDTEEDAKPLVEAIAKCAELHFLNLEGNTLGVLGAKAIGKSLESHRELKRALWKDLFTGRLKTEIPQALQFLGAGLVLANARLVELDMSDNAFGPIGVEGLAVLLRSSACFNLQELRLNNNGLGTTGGKLLARALLDCHRASSESGQPLALKVFVAGRNRLENEGAKALAEVFKRLGSLQEVSMPQNGIYHVGVSALCEALLNCPQLRELNLNDNTVTWKGAEALAKALPGLQHLRLLNLGDCLLKSKGAVILAEALAQGHENLEEVSLGFNEIGARGASAIARSMVGKAKLKQLVLDGNQFGEEGRAALRSQLKEQGQAEALGGLSEDEDDAESEEEKSGEEEEEEESASDVSAPVTPAKPPTPASATPSLRESAPNTPSSFFSLNATRGGSPVVMPSTPSSVYSSPGTKSPVIKPPVFIIPESPERVEMVTVAEFLADPNPNKLVALGPERYDKLLSEFQGLEKDAMLQQGVSMVMAVSSAAATRRPEVQAMAREVGIALYSKLFEWAKEADTLSLLNNALMVNLKLIKSEEKNKFADVPWNLEGCMLVLEQVCQQNLLPFSTKDSLQIFLGRPNIPADSFPDTKRKLLVSLFKY